MAIAIERLQDGAVIELPYEEIAASNAADFQRALATVDTERRLALDQRRIDPTRDAALGACAPAAAAQGGSS